MRRVAALLACLLCAGFLLAQDQSSGGRPIHTYDQTGVVRDHEKPHRFFIPAKGARPGWTSLRLTLTVSPTGDVLDAKPSGDPDALKLWPEVENEVRQWKFIPFEENGKPVSARVLDDVVLIPAEEPPANLVPPPPIRTDSRVSITLTRIPSFWGGPSYTVTVSKDGNLVFRGKSGVVASGTHKGKVNPEEVRRLAQAIVDANFYSMKDEYTAGFTDLPATFLSISIDGHAKQVKDYAGRSAGMPAAVSDLQNRVDALARTERWVNGADGLMPALQAEKFNFHSFEAQEMLKAAASRASIETVQQLLKAGVPLTSLPRPTPPDPYDRPEPGWLRAAASRPEVLQVLMDAGASKNDQGDKDDALAFASFFGNVKSARLLIAYGADANAEVDFDGNGRRSILMNAAESGNPDMVAEILRHHPDLEARDARGRTAMFASDGSGRPAGDPAACVRLLAAAGANVNARDNRGDTPLHTTLNGQVAEELIHLGADVNARNDDGETPIFTTLSSEVVPILIAHGADLTLRDNKGQTPLDAADFAVKVEAILDAMKKPDQH